MKAMAVLMVDFSCALKLSMPLAVLSAMRECSTYKITSVVASSEAVAEADTIVFDKTGTLTLAKPKVADVICFDGYSRETVLRYAACLEEHFPNLWPMPLCVKLPMKVSPMMNSIVKWNTS